MIEELRAPTGRPLEREELRALVARVAARPELWSHLWDRSAAERTYAALHRDDDVDLWALFWRPAHDTGWHDHDTSSGAVHVVEGVLEEHALLIAQPERRTRYSAGGSFTFLDLSAGTYGSWPTT